MVWHTPHRKKKKKKKRDKNDLRITKVRKPKPKDAIRGVEPKKNVWKKYAPTNGTQAELYATFIAMGYTRRECLSMVRHIVKWRHAVNFLPYTRDYTDVGGGMRVAGYDEKGNWLLVVIRPDD